MVVAAIVGGLFAAETTVHVDETTTLDRLNALAVRPGTKILFKRGGVWRGQLKAHSGIDLKYRPLVSPDACSGMTILYH